MIANDISLKDFTTYTNIVYNIGGKFKSLKRKKSDASVKASTGAKMIYAMFLCGHKSVNAYKEINANKKLDLRNLFQKGEYVPKTHGERDCIIDTDYKQIEEINRSVIEKAKENKIFRKNTVDGLCVMAWDGVELGETNKDIEGLPEREYADNDIRKYIKYVVGMNVGERGNFIINSKQLLEKEKITTKRGNERAKTTGETTTFESMWEDTEKLIGRVVDVHVFDALYLNQNITNLINDKDRYFVIRLKDEKRDIYKDAKGLFENREADDEYEIVEIITTKKIKYSKAAKKKDTTKTKIKKEKRKISKGKLGDKVLIDEYVQNKKNSTVKVQVYERVITRKEVWNDTFELTGYKDKNVRVVRSLETNYNHGKHSTQEIYVVTNMLNHNIETILKIMHLRWNIENCGFRTLKQRYNIDHIYIGELNAINYIVQMIFLVFNLLELYTKFRLKVEISVSWNTIFKTFERELHDNKALIPLFNTPG